MGRRHLRIFGSSASLGAASLLWPISALAQTAQDGTDDSGASVETAFRRVKADTDLQFDLPGVAIEMPDAPRQRSGWLEALFELLVPLAKLFIWGAVALLVLGIVWLIVQSLRDIRFEARARREAQGDAQPDLYEPEAGRVRTLLGQADELAAQGRYREAVHLLLFRAIEDIDLARPGSVRRSLTSREIGRLPGLTARTREAFIQIARINERGWFAGLSTDAEHYQAARAAYAQFDGRVAAHAQPQPRLSDLPGATT